ncbi:MAG TPA: hypothetical protein VFE24_15315 [Pirellulales bacterium]|nr:hypothetical protein [Pirellulales bacterium]
MSKLIEALIPLAGAVYCFLAGFRLIGPPPGKDPKADEMHARFGTMLKVCGVGLIGVAIFYLID